jgi:lipopolysaccharide transport system permease protein
VTAAIATRRRRRLVDLTAVLIDRDLSLGYGSTTFGLLWAPSLVLVQVAVLSFVFVRVVPLEVDDYGVFLFSGVLAWHLASSTITEGGQAFTGNRDLVRRPGFPVLVLPVVGAARATVTYVVALPLLVVATAASGRLAVTAAALPVVVLTTLLLVLGPALAVATLNVRHRDVHHLVQVLLGVLFYATPVFYAEERLPDRYAWVADVNPFGWVVTLHRQVLYDGAWPDPGRLAASLAVGATGLVAALLVFRRAEAHLGDDL